MILVGLTGSIGMGKSTTASMFAAEGAPVYDADAAVHEVYGVGGAAVQPVAALFPEAVAAGFVDRARLSERVLKDPAALKRLEGVVHPLLADHRNRFMADVVEKACPVVIFDIPLLFETGGDRVMNAIVVVSCPPEMQRTRVLSRGGMTQDKFQAILKRQTPDAEKQARADFVIDTGRGLTHAQAQVRAVLKALSAPGWRSERIGRESPTP